MQNRIYYLFKKLQKENFDLDKVQLFDDIEKPAERDKFSDYHSKLYTEAKLTLSQVSLTFPLTFTFPICIPIKRGNFTSFWPTSQHLEHLNYLFRRLLTSAFT